MSCSWLTFALNLRCPRSEVKHTKLYSVLVKRQSADTAITGKMAVQHKRSFYFSLYLSLPFPSTSSQIYLHLVIHYFGMKGVFSVIVVENIQNPGYSTFCSNYLAAPMGHLVRGTIPAIIEQYISE